MKRDNIGLLFWGAVGTGKSFLVGCIANVLLEQEIPVRMTNFAEVLNDLSSNFSEKNEYIKACADFRCSFWMISGWNGVRNMDWNRSMQ